MLQQYLIPQTTVVNSSKNLTLKKQIVSGTKSMKKIKIDHRT